MVLGTSNGHGENTMFSQHATTILFNHICYNLSTEELNSTLLEWTESFNSADYRSVITGHNTAATLLFDLSLI